MTCQVLTVIDVFFGGQINGDVDKQLGESVSERWNGRVLQFNVSIDLKFSF